MKTLFVLAALLVLFITYHRHGDSCAKFNGFDSWGNEEDFIWSFPENKQPHVRHCLDKLAKRQGLM